MKDLRKDSYERLTHILHTIDEVERFVEGRTLEDFLNDSLLSSGILYQFTVIGEAVKHLEQGLLEKYPYPWYKVRAFRNLIAHQYFDIKLEAVWQIIFTDIPELKLTVKKIVEKEC